MSPVRNRIGKNLLVYCLAGLIFLFWENLVSSIFGLYAFNVRRTFWGIVYYPLLFLVFGLLAEGFAFLITRIFKSSKWQYHGFIWFSAALLVFIWGGISRQFLIDVLGVAPGKTSYFTNLVLLSGIGLIALIVNFRLAKQEREGKINNWRKLFIFTAVIFIYTIISVKITTIFFSGSEFSTSNIILQPLELLIAWITVFTISKVISSNRSLLAAMVWIPVCITVIVVLISSLHHPSYSSAGDQTLNANKPNIIIMLFDTMRPDHVYHEVEGEQLTPNINKLAQEGRAYPRCFTTSSWTFPTTVSLLTSRYPNEIGYLDNAYVPADFPTMMSCLRENGYFTAGLSANFHIVPRYGFDQLFDRFFYQPGSGPKQMLLPFRSFFPSPLWIDELAYQFGFLSTDLLSTDWEKLNREAFDVIDDVAPNPFFIYMHFIEPHSPYYSSEFDDGLLDLGQLKFTYEYEFSHKKRAAFFQGLKNDFLRRSIETQHQRYMDGVRNADRAVAQMMQVLKDQKLDENTILIIMADHGEEFLEHGNVGHKKSLYQELVTIPLVIHVPDRLPIKLADRETSVSILDVAPTVLDMSESNSEIPDCDGESLLLPSTEPDRYFYTMVEERNYFWTSVAAEPYKLIIREEMEGGTVDTMLFNLDVDPGETANLYPGNLAVIDSLAKILQLQVDQTIEPASEPTRELTTQERERLRALGYTQ